MSIASLWRTRQQRYSLQGEICPDCHQAIFPPRDVCPHCSEAAGPLHTMSGRGEVYSYTKMFNVPDGFLAQRPYTVALDRYGCQTLSGQTGRRPDGDRAADGYL